MKKLLLSFAHPDDESFTCAGTVAKYVKAGWQVDLLCATRGEAGNTGPHGEVSRKQLGEIRQKELENAATTLGISSVTFMDYIDGTLPKLHYGELEDKIYKALSLYMPDVVITFEPNGISNHLDHMRISNATTFVFQKYAEFLASERSFRIQYPERVPAGAAALPEDEPKLYYACMPESIVSFLIKNKSIPAISFDKPWKGTPDKLITTVIDIRKFSKLKAKALRMHETQATDVGRFLSSPTSSLVSHEYFIQRMHGTHEVFFGKNDRVSGRL